MKTFLVLLAVTVSSVSCGRTTEPASHGAELQVVEAGDTITIRTPGGGGYGSS